MRMFRKDEGFTLVELMVVVLIIGILVAVAIPVFNSASANARIRSCQANQRTIDGAVQQYLADDTGATMATMNDITVLWGAKKFIAAEPKCKSASAAEKYSITAGVCNGCPDTDGEAHASYK